MNPPSTLTNSKTWKLWHSFNYFMGGCTFLVGSVILFPFFQSYLDTDNVSSYLFSIGSFTFLIADIAEWMHFVRKDCIYCSSVLNYFISVISSTLYLIGSILFIPRFDSVPLGELLFDIGSCLIVVSQTWKLLYGICQKGCKIRQFIAEDPSGFYIDFFAGFGGLMYLIGTLILQQSQNDGTLLVPAITFYSSGGFCFFLSSVLMTHRYFWQEITFQNTSLLDSKIAEDS